MSNITINDVPPTPALADQWEADALAAIGAINDPAEAEVLLRKVTAAAEAMRLAKLGADYEQRWSRLKLKAERRYGELLPPKQPGKRTDPLQAVTGDQRVAQNRARKVSEVPKDEFDEYVDNASKPSREGLLRKASAKPDTPPPRRRGNNLWENDDVIAWVARRSKAGRTRDQIVDEADVGAHGWPLPGQHLPKNSADIIRAVIEDRARRGDTIRPRKPRESGKRLRQLHDEKNNGRTTSDLWHLQIAVAKSVAVLEEFDLPDLDWTEYNQALVAEIHDDLERNLRWTNIAFDVVVAHMDDIGRRRKITYLDARANDPSSTPNERSNAASLAERLRSKANAARLGEAG